MRVIIFILLIFSSYQTVVGVPSNESFYKDSLIVVKNDPSKGFHSDYLLFIPKGIKLNGNTTLLVETNNTGTTSDSMEIHFQHAVDLASKSSVGNNISTELKIPLLVPVFTRPASKPLMYTHALDRDVIEESSPELKRLDLQLLAMIDDAKNVLAYMGIRIESKFFLNGFSASATFANRFSFIHPEKIKAMAIGGFNGNLMLPLAEMKGVRLNYPIGINDFEQLFSHPFNVEAFNAIPKFIYMGALDENDAVQFDDAFDDTERTLINKNLGANVQDRFKVCQSVYKDLEVQAIFKTYENVGHFTTSNVNLEVILFFLEKMKKR